MHLILLDIVCVRCKSSPLLYSEVVFVFTAGFPQGEKCSAAQQMGEIVFFGRANFFLSKRD